MNPEAPQGDYVLVPARKAKISRARKGIIGMMVMGAVVALGGAGSFASFTAETTNDAAFQTARLVLGNSVQGGAGVCFSSGQPGVTATQDAANLDANENTTCDDLFDDFITPGNTATAGVALTTQNGNIEGALSVYTNGGCTDDINIGPNAGSDTLCDDITFSLRRADSAFTPIANDDSECIYPATACDTAPGTLGGFAAGSTGFAAADVIDATFGDDDDTTNETQYVLVTMSLPHGINGAGCTGTEQLGTNGQGCDNVYMDREALFDLVFRMVQ